MARATKIFFKVRYVNGLPDEIYLPSPTERDRRRFVPLRQRLAHNLARRKKPGFQEQGLIARRRFRQVNNPTL